MNLYLETIIGKKSLQVSVISNLNVYYNNIHKVLWEPFVEPWAFEVSMIRKHDKSGLVGNGILTDIQLKSTTGLNINFNEPAIEEKLRVLVLVSKAAFQFIQRVSSDYKVPKEVKAAGFDICGDKLGSIVEGHDLKKLKGHGGVGGISEKLRASITEGLNTDSESLSRRQEIYGKGDSDREFT